MTPLRSLLMMASSDDSTMAARRRRASSAWPAPVTSPDTRATPAPAPAPPPNGAAAASNGPPRRPGTLLGGPAGGLLLKEAAGGLLGLPARGQVAGDLREPTQPALLVAQRGDVDAGPVAGAILAPPPALLLEPALGPGDRQ